MSGTLYVMMMVHVIRRNQSSGQIFSTLKKVEPKLDPREEKRLKVEQRRKERAEKEQAIMSAFQGIVNAKFGGGN